MRIAVVAVFLALLLLAPHAARAHKASDSFLTMSVAENSVTGQWDIALRDLDHAIGLDLDDDGAITWGELRDQEDAVAAYALSRLRLRADDAICPIQAQDHLVDRHSDGAYAVLRFAADCPTPIRDLEIRYNLLFDLDPQHRGLIQVDHGGQTRSSVFSPSNRVWRVAADNVGVWQQFTAYLKEGVWHIWTGFDHLLFLITLLLPAVTRRHGRDRRATTGLSTALMGVVKIVTAFTIAHSLTLGLSVAGLVDLPSAFVEPAIAASLVLAALNNIYPVITRSLWALAFGFGLVHGFGFAGALQDLGLPAGALAVSLFSFNLGVELGQLVIVCAFVPLAFYLARTLLYRQAALRFGSVAIAAIASLWLAERTFGLELRGL